MIKRATSRRAGNDERATAHDELRASGLNSIQLLRVRRPSLGAARTLFVTLALLSAQCAQVLAQTQTQPPPSSTTQPSPPAGTTTQQQNPGSPPPPTTSLPPNAPSSTIRPGNEAQQSTQPQTGPEQERQSTSPNTQGPRPPSPQTPGQQPPGGQTPQTATPAGTTPAQTGTNPGGAQATGAQGVQQTPSQNVGTSGVAPAELPTEPPPVAPNFEAPLRPLPSAERVGVDMGDQTSLTLNDVIAMALANNNDIDGSRIDVEVAEYNLTAARGVYDPVISSESYFENRTTPTSSTIAGGLNGSVTQKDATGALRFGGFSPFAGGAYQLDFSATRLQTNNQNVTLNPQYPSALTFTYTQPLIRGLRFDNNRRQIEIAKKNLSLTDAQFRQRAIETITLVEQAYWDLAYALRNLQVQIDAVKQARAQVESNQRLVEQGVLAPIDIVAASTQVTTFEQSIYTAQESVTRAENTLKTLILPDRNAQLWSRPITPVTPVSLEAPRVPLEQAVKAALVNRPELAQLQTNAEINKIDERYFRDLTRPQLDLVGTYTATGLAGVQVTPTTSTSTSANALLRDRVNQLSAIAGLPPLPTSTSTTTVPENLVGGLTKSLSNLAGRDYPTYRVGVVVSLPLRNRTAEANFGRTLAEGRRIQNQRAQQEQVIEADVRNAVQSLRSAEARLASAAATRLSAERQYESEQRQFRAGTTTVYLVLQRQTELLTARGSELQAQTDLNKAIAEFQRATGNTLEANNVAVRTDTPSRELELRAAHDAVSPGVGTTNGATANTANSATNGATNSSAGLTGSRHNEK